MCYVNASSGNKHQIGSRDASERVVVLSSGERRVVSVDRRERSNCRLFGVCRLATRVGTRNSYV